MDMLWRRRSALFTLTFVYTGFAVPFFSTNIRLILLAGTAGLLAIACIPPLTKILRTRIHEDLPAVFRLLLCAGLLSLLFFTAHQYVTVDRPQKQLCDTTAQITAVIREPVYIAVYGASYIADVSTDDGTVSSRVLLQTPDTGLTAGDTVACTASFTAFQEYDGSFPERRYYYSLRTVLRAETDSTVYLGHVETVSLRRLFSDWQTSLGGILRADLGRENSALATALFLGDRADLPDTLTRDFKRLGISHLLAISGLHFTLLLSGLDCILRLFLKNKKCRTAILAAADIGYMLLCGLAPSVVRAGVMMLILYAAFFFSRKSHTSTSLGVAAFLMCTADPSAVYSIALQLSVTSVLALCVFSHIEKTFSEEKPVSKKSRLLRSVSAALLLPITVQIVLLPLLCLYFGEVSLITPLATVLFTPLVELILLLTPLCLLLRATGPLAFLLGSAIGGLTEITAGMAGALASLRGITLSLAYPFAPAYAVTLSGLLLTAPLYRKRKALFCHLAGIAGILLLFFLSVTVTNVTTADEVKILSAARGKNDAVIVMTAGDTLLMDISDGTYSALYRAYTAAANSGAAELEGLYLTHLHKRHVTGVRQLCDAVYVRSLLLPAPEKDTEIEVYHSLTALAAELNIPVYTYTAADGLTWGNNVEILPMEPVYIDRSNQPILSFTVRANGADFTYMGAAASEIPAYNDQSAAHILVFGGHGPLYKTEMDVSLSDSLRAAVFRSESAGYISPALRDALKNARIYADDETVSFVLKP